ncbi:MAG: apolipoprotein N-acyltransferase [Planctomycetota bacterium]
MTEQVAEEGSKSPGLSSPAAVGLGLLHSVLMVLAFPPLGFWGAALAAVLPAALAARSAGRRPKRTSLWFGLGAMAFWGLTHRWAFDVSAAGGVPLLVYLALTTSLGVWLMAFLARGRLPLPLAAGLGWTAAEVVRGEIVWDGYPWYLVGHPLIDASLLGAAGAVIGAYGVSFLVSSAAGAVGEAMLGSVARARVAGAVVAAVWIGCGLLGMPRADAEVPTLRVGLVTTNVPQSVRGGWPPVERVRTLVELHAATRELAMQGAKLIVWPETMFPGVGLQPEVNVVFGGVLGFPLEVTETAEVASMLDGSGIEAVLDVGPGGRGLVDIAAIEAVTAELIRDLDTPVLIGSPAFEGFRLTDNGTDWTTRYNSAFIYGAGSQPRYDKVRLTPFGEVMPYISAWPWLERQLLAIGAQGMSFDLGVGKRFDGFRVLTSEGEIRVVTPICFEATMSGHVRRLVSATDRRADLIAQLTNDGWFMDVDVGRLTHQLCARWRALETGTPLVRAANTGPSAAVDAGGRVVQAGAVRESGTVLADVPMWTRSTLYLAGGWWFRWLCLLGAVVGCLLPRRSPPG